MTCGGGRARGEMIMAGADDGFVGLRDHIANSFLDCSTDETAECFVTRGEMITGEARSDDGGGGTSGDWGTGSGTEIGSDIRNSSGVCSVTRSETDSATGSGAGFSVCSVTSAKVGSWTGSDI